METYRVELANKIRNGAAVGNLYLVIRYLEGRRANIVATFDRGEDAEVESVRLNSLSHCA